MMRRFEEKGVMEMSQHIWEQSLKNDSDRPVPRDALPVVIVMAQDDLHPLLGIGYVDSSCSRSELYRQVRARNQLVDATYLKARAELQRGRFAAAKEIAAEDPYRCVGICESQKDVFDFFRYEFDCGSEIAVVSDTDFFVTENRYVTTWAPEYSSFAFVDEA